MPRPLAEESREDFLHRYMADAEAQRSFPDEKQRFAVASSLWEHKNDLVQAANSLGYNEEKEGAEPFSARHLQPGVVNYAEMKHPLTGKQGIAVLVEKEVMDQMRPSMKGIPILNWTHASGKRAETDRWIKEGKAVGMVVGSRWEGHDGWDHCDYFVWDREAKANCHNGFRVSNAWTEDEIDWKPGVHNGVAYDGRLVAAHYTHLAIVPNPRYEGAVIYANSQGGLKAMLKLFGIGKTEAVELDKEAALDVGGKKYTALEVVNAMAAIEADKAKVTTNAKEGILAEGDSIQIGEKKYTGLEVANAMAAASAASKAKEEVVTPVKVEAENGLPKTKEEFVNAINDAVKTALEALKGDTFFNAVAKLAQIRPADGGNEQAAGRQTERERVAEGRKRFGRKTSAA